MEAEKKVISNMLEEIILRVAPKAQSVPKYGGVLYTVYPDRKEGQFCGIFEFTNHVQLTFANGAELKDPKGVLLGKGKFRRHVNFESADEVNPTILAALLKQSVKLSK